MAWTTPATFAVGEVATSTKINTLVADVAYLHGDVGDFTVGAVYEVFSDAYVGRVAAGVPGGGSSSNKKAFQRHPYSVLHHIESGTVAFGNVSNGTSNSVSVTYTAAGASGAVPVGGPSDSTSYGLNFLAASRSASGFTAYGGNLAGGTANFNGDWIADIF